MNQGGTPGASVREGYWKLIRFFEDGHEELYNLREDIGEEKNLRDERPEIGDVLSQPLTQWQGEIEAVIPDPNGNYVAWENREPCARFPGDRAGGDAPRGVGAGSGVHIARRILASYTLGIIHRRCPHE